MSLFTVANLKLMKYHFWLGTFGGFDAIPSFICAVKDLEIFYMRVLA